MGMALWGQPLRLSGHPRTCCNCLRQAQRALAASGDVGSKNNGRRRYVLAEQRRLFQTSKPLRDDGLPRRQAQPLGDFYTDLLATPIPKDSKATSDLPTFVSAEDESKAERAAKLFGNTWVRLRAKGVRQTGCYMEDDQRRTNSTATRRTRQLLYEWVYALRLG